MTCSAAADPQGAESGESPGQFQRLAQLQCLAAPETTRKLDLGKKVDTGHREARGLPRTPRVFPTSDPRYFLRSLGPEHVQGRPAPPWQPATSLNPKDTEVLRPTCPLWLTSKASANFLMGQVPYSLDQRQLGPGVINKLPTPPGSGKLKRWHTIDRWQLPLQARSLPAGPGSQL